MEKVGRLAKQIPEGWRGAALTPIWQMLQLALDDCISADPRVSDGRQHAM